MEKLTFGDVFKDREERSTVFIAFLVLLFFGWLIYYLGFFNNQVGKESPTILSEPAVEEISTTFQHDVSMPIAIVDEEDATKLLEDQDGDSVYDADDECPNKAGMKDNNGCPIIALEAKDKATLELVVKAVQFQIGKTILTSDSFPILDDVLDILNKYPDHHLRIEGHTDNQGAAAGNLKLSKGRAATCYEFFTSRGISANRLEYEGYGETRPLTPNNTPAGRAQNRRVQFKVFIP